MMKKVLLVSLVALATGCSTAPTKDVAMTEPVSVSFMSGEVVMTISKDGQFESLTSSATARVSSGLPSARDEAVIVASLRAKQKIVEFMENEIQGDKFVNTTTKSLQKARSVNGAPDSDVDSSIAYDVQENIAARSRAVLRGVSVQSVEMNSSSNTIKVTVRTGAKEIGASSQLRSLMR